MSALYQLTDRIWIYSFEEERDRPNLGYIRGDRWSLAIDAGHSENPVRSFYAELENKHLPLPALTVLTHWHWDHTFGMHATHGLCMANGTTLELLLAFKKRLESEGPGFFLSMNPCIRREYADARPIVVPADLVFHDSIVLDTGNCPVRVFQSQSPHTSDSTLIELPGEQVLFLGDATCGPVGDYDHKDPGLCLKLIEAIQTSRATLCIEGHWTPLSAEEVIQDLRNDILSR